MAQNLDRFEELEKLLSALADDELDAAGRTRIGELLDGDPEACEFYLDYMALDAHLEQELGSVEPIQFLEKLPQAQIEEATTIYLATRQPPPPPIWKQPWTIAAAAAVLAGVLVINLMIGREKDRVAQENVASATDNTVAVLTDLIDARFADGTQQPTGGDLLPKGVLRLEAGLARVEFYSGAVVVLEGPVEFELLGDNIAACRKGNFRASVPRPAQGFTVHSPQVEMVDLGTEFAASIDPDGTTEIHVFEGEVEVYDAGTDRAPHGRHLLTAGYGLQVDPDGTKTDTLADSMAFVSEDEVDQRSRTHSAERHEAWQQFAAETLSRDPRVMAHYPFESNSGTNRVLLDRAELGGLRNGTIVDCQWASGRWLGKQALEFNRPSDRVRIQMKEKSAALTMVAWINVERLEQRFSALLLTDRLNKGGVEWQITRAGSLQFGVRTNGRHTDNYASPIAFGERIGKWTQVAVSIDPEAHHVRHFINGELLSTHPLKSNTRPIIGGAQLGNWNAPREGDSYPIRNLHGRIDEFLIFNEALGENEIRDLYKIGLP